MVSFLGHPIRQGRNHQGEGHGRQSELVEEPLSLHRRVSERPHRTYSTGS